MTEADLCFYFVIDGPRLELQSLLLAATLRRHHPRAALIGYVSAATEAALAPHSRALHAATGLALRPLPPPGALWAKPYPHGNKLLAAAEPRAAAVSVFLDTDMVCVTPLDPADLPAPGEVCLVPEGVASWGAKGDRWARAYAFMGLLMPTDRVRLIRHNREFLPYFNAGFVAFREDDRVGGKTFGALWRDTASRFDHKAKVAGKRPWLDQITLPLTIARHGFRYRVIGAENNLTISNRDPVPGLRPKILHYHRGRHLIRWPHWPEVLETVCAALPPPHRAAFLSALEAARFGAEDPDAPPPAEG